MGDARAPDRRERGAEHPSAGGRLNRESRPAYYAAGPGAWRDWWTLLHPPYTAWNLSYAVIGASLAPRVNATRLVGTVLAFFFAVGIAAHAFDELNGRPLRTRIPGPALVAAGVLGLVGALGLGIVGVTQVGWVLIPFMVVGPILVIGYCSELMGGILHNDATFAVAWGAFPVLTAYVAQTEQLAVAPAIAAFAAIGFSAAQRSLSTPARSLRRRVSGVDGILALSGGERVPLDKHTLLVPLEQALRAMSWAIVLLAASIAVARLA